MGFRFRKSIKLLPGIKINFGKKSASVTIGSAGACMNFSKKGTRATIGLPGTGISYSSYCPRQKKTLDLSPKSAQAVPQKPSSPLAVWICILSILFCCIAFCTTVHSPNSSSKNAIASSQTGNQCRPTRDGFEICKGDKPVRLRSKINICVYEFNRLMGIKGFSDYVWKGGIEHIKNVKYPDARYALTFILNENFKNVPGTEKTLIMDKNFKGLKVFDGSILTPEK